MSSRTRAADKAVRLAWEREQERVREGKGTRDWTAEQQRDILDPDIGKARDENNRAFEGQHMRSVEKNPEYQGNPDNIQFLTRAEHFEAHKKNWQNPTNWYYDPVTKEYVDFGDGEIIPCKTIDLSNPIVATKIGETEVEKNNKESALKESSDEKDVVSTKREDNLPKEKVQKTAQSNPRKKPTIPKAPIKHENGFVKGLKSVGRFIVNHPVESIEIVGTVIVGAAEVISKVRHNNGNGTHGTSLRQNAGSSPKPDIATKVADIVEKATRAENDVSGHRQRYHTKDGVIWKDKAPYHRGGKDS